MLPALGLLRRPDVEAGLTDADANLGAVLGDFRVIREIGHGGMAVVYEAEQLTLNRKVALKVLPFAAVLDPRKLQRFKNEAEAAARLHHEHIVPVHCVGCERGGGAEKLAAARGRSRGAGGCALGRSWSPGFSRPG